MKKLSLAIISTILISVSARSEITPSKFSELTAPFSETITLAGADQPDSIEAPHFLYALNPSTETASIRFLDSSTLTVAARFAYLAYVNSDGSHQVLIGPIEIVDPE